MDHHYPPPPPRYIMLNDSDSLRRPPPSRRNLPRYDSPGPPRYHSPGPGGGRSCCRCMCWFCCFLILFMVAMAGAAVYFFLVINPKAPSYSVDHLSVDAFKVNSEDLTIHIKVVASVRAENPNDMIGIYYRKGSKVVITYRNATLCQGHIPSFYQGHRNKTVIPVAMEGQSGFHKDLQEAMKEDRAAGKIPIHIYLRVPLVLRLDDFDTREVIANIACSLVVDKLSPNAKVAIKSAHYKVDVEF